jgi:nucleotide-binding universal stress UspA family protein
MFLGDQSLFYNSTWHYVYYREYLLEKARKFMSNTKTSAARHGIDLEKVVTSTYTIKVITNFAKSGKFDIIVIGARGAGSPKSEFFGSVSNGILQGLRTYTCSKVIFQTYYFIG